jgi:DNA repair protein RAD50
LTQQRTALSNNTLKLHRMEAEIKEKHLKLLRVEELQRGIVTHQEVIAGVNIELDQSIAMIQVTEKALSEAKAESLTKERELGRELSSVAQALSEMESIMASVTEYAGREAKLFDCQNRVVSLLGEIENAQSAIDRSTEKLSVAEKALVDMRGHERNLRDNHEVRRMRHEIDEMNETITSLEAQHAEQEKENYEREASRLQQKYVKLNSNFSSRMGEIKQMDDQLARETEELNSRFKDHGENYRRALISLRTVEVANEDLAKYAKALDSAIMTYHSMKMEEINRIVDELWKKTYTGTDVDTIMIRSDNENSRGNRSYNYRVCMMKQDVELDMRGRCSAGQKVLASIIIRLALAECFGKNCGVIALDEPTTNLDSDNIESLANALSAIIETRRVQKNFQLIVITHDEHFLRHMNAAAYTDHFFRVERNPHQLSKISVVPISRVTE